MCVYIQVYIHAKGPNNAAEDHVFPIKPRRDCSSQEKLPSSGGKNCRSEGRRGEGDKECVDMYVAAGLDARAVYTEREREGEREREREREIGARIGYRKKYQKKQSHIRINNTT
jgi:hypothetical protein